MGLPFRIDSQDLVHLLYCTYFFLIIENLSEITAGSPMVGTPINLVQRLISPGLIKDAGASYIRAGMRGGYWWEL